MQGDARGTWPGRMRQQPPGLAVRTSDPRVPAIAAAPPVVTGATVTEGTAWCCQAAHIAPPCSRPAECECLQNGPPSVGRNHPTMMATTQTTMAVPSAFGKPML